MPRVTLDIADELVARFRREAERLDVTVEELVEEFVASLPEPPDERPPQWVMWSLGARPRLSTRSATTTSQLLPARSFMRGRRRSAICSLGVPKLVAVVPWGVASGWSSQVERTA